MRHSARSTVRGPSRGPSTRRGARMVRRAARPVTSRRPGRLGVLAYHRVAAPLHDPWSLAVTPEHLDQQLAVLRDAGRVDSLDDVLAATWRDRCRRRTPRFAITFDDGYADNLLCALAVLERHDAPATVFIATGMLDEPAFWWDVLAELTFATGDHGRRAHGVGAAARPGGRRRGSVRRSRPRPRRRLPSPGRRAPPPSSTRGSPNWPRRWARGCRNRPVGR